MKTIKTKQILTLLLTAIAMSGMIGCSSKQNNSSSSSPSAANPATGLAITWDASGQAITPCVKDSAGLADLGVNAQVYYANNTPNYNWVRVKFNSFPSAFTASNALIAFWTYYMTSASTYSTWMQAPFFVEYTTGAGSFTAVSSTMTSISKTDILTLAAQNGNSTTSVAAALANLTFVLQLDSNSNLSASQAFSAALYSNGATAGTGTSPNRYVSSLLPQIYANPATYASTHYSPLTALHPLVSSRYSNLSQQQAADMTMAMCF